jgi:hypothetical protein
MQEKESLIYTYKKSDNCYYNLIPINEFNKEFWHNIEELNNKDSAKAQAEFEKIVDEKEVAKKRSLLLGISEGVVGMDVRYEHGAQQYVAIVSYEPIKDPNNIKLSEVEMAMMVATGKGAIFSVHMGIFRPYATIFDSRNHRNIAMELHSFCAKVMKELYPDIQYMVNAPTPMMAFMVEKVFQDVEGAVYNNALSYNVLSNLDKEEIEGIAAIKAKEVVTSDAQARNAMLVKNSKMQLKVLAGKDYYPMVQDGAKYKFYKNFDDYKKDIPYLEFSRNDPEYKWFSQWKNLGANTKMIVNIEKLAAFSNAEYIAHSIQGDKVLAKDPTKWRSIVTQPKNSQTLEIK